MAEEGFKRKLSAILSADAVEYSRLMGEDEESTVRTLNTYREVFTALIQQHNGKVLDSTGDNLMAEFVSVVDAVQCAVAVQKEIKARNDELAENRRMQFRIGINLGDVIQEKGRIYGDGVNIAARLEGLAEPGGICISKTAFDHIESKLPYGYEFLGDQTVKNITKPVGAYRVLMEPRVTVAGELEKEKPSKVRRMSILVGAAAVLTVVIAVGIWQFYNSRLTPEPTPVDERTLSQLEKPSIAVMPFKNMSDDPEQDFISDGISESIISALSKIPHFFVIASKSTFFYKDKPVKITQIGQELGVRYVLEGSVLKSGEQVRINAQLIDALKGHHVWSETYDRQWTDFLTILDEITLAVGRSISGEIGLSFGADITGQYTDNVEAWLINQKASVHFHRYTREDNAVAIDLARRAIEIDPNYSTAYSTKAMCLANAARYRWTTSPKEFMTQAKETILKAIELDNSNPIVYVVFGEIQLVQKNYDDALVAMKKALDLSPSFYHVYMTLARCLLFLGQPEEALPLIMESMRLNPHYAWFFPSISGRAYYHTGRYAEALTEFEKVYEICNRGDCSMYFPHVYLAMLYGKLGREKEASYHMGKVLEIKPRFNLEARRRASLFKNKEDTDREIDALRKAGAPEHPPLKIADKPSIAVLAFDNHSGDPEQDYLSDGISDSIISALSKIPYLFVIAKNSSFFYKDKPVKITQVGQEIGVRYVLEGSVLKSGEKVRVNAQLIDALKGHHVWSETYNRQWGDFLTVLDEITLAVARSLSKEFGVPFAEDTTVESTNNAEAWLILQKASHYYDRWTREDNAIAMNLAKQVIKLDPNYPHAYAALSRCLINAARYRWSKSPEESMMQAKKMAQKALELDDTLAHAYLVLGELYLNEKKYDDALVVHKKAVDLNPNSGLAHHQLARCLTFSGQPEEALPSTKTAMRLNPHYPWGYPSVSGRIYYHTGRYEEALIEFEKVYEICRRGDSSMYYPHVYLAMTYSQLDREKEAQYHMKKALEFNPRFNLEARRKASLFKNKEDTDREIEGLRKAGAPEHPPPK